MNLMKIYKISYEIFGELYSKWAQGLTIPNSLFICPKNNKYLAIDNEYNNFFIEEFNTKKQAICWLIRNDFSKKEIAELKTVKIDKLLSKIDYKIVDYQKEFYEL